MHPTFMIVIYTLELVGARDCCHSKLTLSRSKTMIAFFNVVFLSSHTTGLNIILIVSNLPSAPGPHLSIALPCCYL